MSSASASPSRRVPRPPDSRSRRRARAVPLPAVDERLVMPETRFEIIDGEVVDGSAREVEPRVDRRQHGRRRGRRRCGSVVLDAEDGPRRAGGRLVGARSGQPRERERDYRAGEHDPESLATGETVPAPTRIAKRTLELGAPAASPLWRLQRREHQPHLGGTAPRLRR